MDERQITQLAQRWADAEQTGDTVALSALLTDDFIGIGPAGFLLDRAQWLGRLQSGDLQYRALTWKDLHVQLYADATIVTGTQLHEATYQGQPASGQFRSTQVYVNQGNHWRLAGLQLSPTRPLGASEAAGTSGGRAQ